jgi:hypothetical protein
MVRMVDFVEDVDIRTWGAGASDPWLLVVSGSGREFVSGERRAAMRTRLVVAFILLKIVFIVSARRVETVLVNSNVCCDDCKKVYLQLLFEDV